ncbi:protein FAM43A-like [Artemia franciscana]|uniref:PID domain-containing protein n=1 Tax=Artemia franciscana TaxID=6661 RepID=A0AA88LAS5_ARTSF|nr:hypothetical protein QYM36_005025 [Artemia franciscana]KAK2719399.1 hypothetical protein QYM36_005025 [Artemia franciscana]
MPVETSLFRRLFRRKSQDSEDAHFKVIYLGNVLTGFARGEGCLEKPLSTLWRNYVQSNRLDVKMVLRLSPGGLKATTKEHGLTEYWGHRVTTCSAPSHYPHIFAWVYRHETTRLKQELRCHAVLCRSNAQAKYLAEQLRIRLEIAFSAFRAQKLRNQQIRLGQPVDGTTQDPALSRLELFSYKPPLEKSKAAPKLTSIAEDGEVQSDALEIEEPPRSFDWVPLPRLPETADAIDTESVVEIGENLVTLSPSGDTSDAFSTVESDKLSLAGENLSPYSSQEKLGDHATSLLDIMLESLNLGSTIAYTREIKPITKRNRSMSLSAADRFSLKNFNDSAYGSSGLNSPVKWRRTKSFHRIAEEPEFARRQAVNDFDNYSMTGSVSASPERTPKYGFRVRDETDSVSDESGYSEDKDGESVEMKSNVTGISTVESSMCEEFEIKL